MTAGKLQVCTGEDNASENGQKVEKGEIQIN